MGGGVKNGTSITFTEYLDKKVFQRVGTSKQITISGTYGGTPSLIQAQVVDTNGGVVVPWTTIVRQPSGNTYSGSLSVPQGCWYKVKVRAGNSSAPSVTATNKFGVGMVIGLIGQSNMARFPITPYQYPLGSPNIVDFDQIPSPSTPIYRRVGNINDTFPPNTLYGTGGYNSYTTDGNNADGYVYVANIVSASLNIPVCLLERAVGGSSITTWISGGQNNWSLFATDVTASGGDLEVVLWYQGETDAHTISTTTWANSLATVQTQCQNLVGRTSSNFKFGVVSLGPGSYNGSVDGEFGAYRVAQINYAKNTAGAFLASCNHDVKTILGDDVHLDAEGYSRIGRRYAKAILFALGVGTSADGPYISSATRSGTVITVNIAHSGGTSLTDGNGGNGTALTGFRVYDNGVLATISSTQISGNTVLLTLSATPTGTVTMDYGIMNAPHGTSNNPQTFVLGSVVYDNSTYLNSTVGSPLQPKSLITVI